VRHQRLMNRREPLTLCAREQPRSPTLTPLRRHADDRRRRLKFAGPYAFEGCLRTNPPRPQPPVAINVPAPARHARNVLARTFHRECGLARIHRRGFPARIRRVGTTSRSCDGTRANANWPGRQSFSRASVLSTITPSHPEAAAELYRGVGSQPSSALALAFDSGSQACPNAVAGYEATRPTKPGGIGQGRGLCSLAFSSRT
jgi:hypothetical protein